MRAAGQRQWDEQSFFGELVRRSPARADIARRLFEWSKRNMTDFWYGNGSTAGSCIPRLFLPPRRLLLFALWTYGSIEIQLQHMRVPPFDDEDFRREFIHRLNGIPGIAIPEEAVRRRPAIDMLALQDDTACTQFIDVMEWAITTARSTNASA